MSEKRDLKDRRVSPLSIVGFIFGCGFLTAPVGLALSAVALSEIKHNPTSLRGSGLAKWGMGLSIASLCWLGVCGLAYQHNLKLWRERLRDSEVVINANRNGRNSWALEENLAAYERDKKNSPSFFDPFGN